MISDEIYLLSRLKNWRRRAEHAKMLILQALTVPVHWAVSFSGGKDSTVLLDLVISIEPEIDVIWLDDGWDYPETLNYIKDTESRIGKKIMRVEQPVQSNFWKNEIKYGGDDPGFEHPIDFTYQEWRLKFGGSFLGLRREESTQRNFTLGKSALYYQSSFGHWHCSPLANWSWQDIWGYIGGNNIPYNPVYDRLAEIGIPLSESRVGPLTAWMVYQYGALAIIKRGWPELYNRFVSAHPGLRQYV